MVSSSNEGKLTSWNNNSNYFMLNMAFLSQVFDFGAGVL
jgi:hypothetical protein